MPGMDGLSCLDRLKELEEPVAVLMVTLYDDHWHCSCDFFADHETCCHTMALERILEPMLPAGLQTAALVPA